ncbi:antiviral reverse transcriptase Drt4 [Burkholderia gladioli]|uniref:antiviral reverse transcriptase Drt4 n=1 Tax=Burkholderia gladioli TaxID=28095 RepID=UPI00163E468F|nr:antiviral reverse transcriptase Drt4 [Burkholderia gladioli]
MFLREDTRYAFEALTRWNYFPNQKFRVGELPPSISTRQFTPEIAQLVAACKDSMDRGNSWYDDVSYFMTRYDNVPRELSLTHPRAYSRIAVNMAANWSELAPLIDSPNSAVKPEYHDDGRLLIMNYEDPHEKTKLALMSSFGKRFRVHTDIAGCFHSIYAHSIPWATVGFEQEKKRVRTRGAKHWSNELDTLQCAARRGETVGMAIGPGTSSVIVELILGKVDAKLREAKFEFRRYIDDYICYCETHEKANDFLNLLADALSAYRLRLSIDKTAIVELPEPLVEPWVMALGTALDSRLVREQNGIAKMHSADAIHYLDYATRLNKDTRDGSVLRYAVGSMLPYLTENALATVADYLVNLSWHFPSLIPYLAKLVENEINFLEPYEEQINTIIVENARHRRSDGMVWSLHLLKVAKLKVSSSAIDAVLMSRDCVACTLLYELHQADDRLVAFANDVKAASLMERDQQWLLLYQLHLHGAIAIDDEPSFNVLKQYNVNFVPSDGEKTAAERYCEVLNNPFLAPDDILPFATWLAAESGG